MERKSNKGEKKKGPGLRSISVDSAHVFCAEGVGDYLCFFSFYVLAVSQYTHIHTHTVCTDTRTDADTHTHEHTQKFSTVYG